MHPKMNLLVSLLVFLATTQAEKMRFDNYTLLRITPKSQEALEILRDWEYTGHQEFNFWSSIKNADSPVDVMVAPYMKSYVGGLVKSKGMISEVLMDNVQEHIDKQGFRPVSRAGTFGWTNYHTLDEIYAWLRGLPARFPGIVELINAGQSHERRQLLGVKVSFSSTPKKTVFIEGTIHAREWISPAVTTFFLNELLTSTNETVQAFAARYDWYVFPVFNPDGYVFSHTTNRMWRKTRVPYGLCFGADPNRNWGYRWNTGGASSIPCSDIYAGPRPYSEPSTLAMANLVSRIAETEDLFAYISLHSFSQMILLPYGYTSAHLDNYYPMMEVLYKTKDALARRFGTQYVVGNAAEVLYVTSGCSIDWIKGTYNTPIALTYELRDLGRHGFLLPANEIIPSGLETLDSFIVLLLEGEATLDKTIKL